MQGVWPLHWPVVNSPHMEEKLGRREMELKRKEDALRCGGGVRVCGEICQISVWCVLEEGGHTEVWRGCGSPQPSC